MITSGPVSQHITTFAKSCVTRFAEIIAVKAPFWRALRRPARTNGVCPLAAMPITQSISPARHSSTARAPSPSPSSSPSCAQNTAFVPPAILTWSQSGAVPNVGGHSAASITAIRALVPAARYKTRPPRGYCSTKKSTTRAMAGISLRTTLGGIQSSSFIRSKISRVVF